MSVMTNPGWINESRKAGEPYKCEEASYLIPSTPQMFVPCGALAPHLLHSEKDKRTYHMCDACAAHNERRGMVRLAKPREALLGTMAALAGLLNLEEPPDDK